MCNIPPELTTVNCQPLPKAVGALNIVVTAFTRTGCTWGLAVDLDGWSCVGGEWHGRLVSPCGVLAAVQHPPLAHFTSGHTFHIHQLVIALNLASKAAALYAIGTYVRCRRFLVLFQELERQHAALQALLLARAGAGTLNGAAEGAGEGAGAGSAACSNQDKGLDCAVGSTLAHCVAAAAAGGPEGSAAAPAAAGTTAAAGHPNSAPVTGSAPSAGAGGGSCALACVRPPPLQIQLPFMILQVGETAMPVLASLRMPPHAGMRHGQNACIVLALCTHGGR